MIKNILTLLFTSSFLCNAQRPGEPKIEKFFLEKNDTARNCYTVLNPSQSPLNGYIFLIPGMGESAEEVFLQTDLPQKLAQSGFLTIIPTFQDGVSSFGVDSLSQKTFNTIVKEVTSKYKLAGQKMYVGGFSIGGSCAIKFSELATIKPVAVFAVDPPLDFERIYNSRIRDLRISRAKGQNQDDIYFVKRIEKEMNGTPKTALKNYYKTSPYSFSDSSQSAIKNLITIPIRIYSEPDINWWLNERGADFTRMNVTECSALINELTRLGNNNATLITTVNKGYRKPNHKRQPHSWSIVDNDELIKWLSQAK